MKRKIAYLFLSFCLALSSATGGLAGGVLETIDLTAQEPSTVPGYLWAPVVGIKWDSRCIPVQFSLNRSQDPIPNPQGAAFLSLERAQHALADALKTWNEIPTSFI